MSRKTPTPIAKPETVLVNAYKEAANYWKIDFDKTVKLGDLLSKLADSRASHLWDRFIQAIDTKFFEKDFSHADLWRACLEQKVNPLHITHAIDHGGILGRNAARPNLVIYKDGAKDHDDMAKLYGHLDTLLEASLKFKAPYEQAVWFQRFKPTDLNREWIHLMARNVGYGMAMIQTFLMHSRHAKDFCFTHADDILEFAPDKEKSDLLGGLLEAISEVGFDLKSPHEYVLSSIDQGPLFEEVLTHVASNIQPLDQLDEYTSDIFVGPYVKARFQDDADHARICAALGKTGINEITGSVAKAEFGTPERFMTLASSMSVDLARTLFSVTAARAFYSYSVEDQLTILNEYDDWFRNNGFGTVFTSDMLDRLTSDLATTQMLAEKGLVDFPTFAKKTYFNHKLFCSRVQGERDSMFSEPEDVQKFVELCKEIRAQEHIVHTLDEMLSKSNGDVRFRTETSKKAFIEAVLVTKVVDPDEVMKTDKRIEKLVAMGISPLILKTSRNYKGKWLDSSLGSDLGL